MTLIIGRSLLSFKMQLKFWDNNQKLNS